MDPYFLEFAPKTARKLSYAASVSVDSIDVDFEDVYRRGLKNLDFISVREQQGAELLKRYSDKLIRVVLDPTLLLNRSEWLVVASNRVKFDFKYVISYSLNSSCRYDRLLLRFAQDHGLRIVNLSPSSTLLGNPIVVDARNAGPREFVSLIDQAQVVVTNSFHGTAFAINFGKPFISILNPASSLNSRVLNITHQLGLEQCVVYDNVRRIKDCSAVDWEQVRRKLELMRKDSLSYLREALDA